ncbi:hypothetical protein D3C81_664860 [compost metagenome]
MARAAAGSLRASGITVALIDLQGRACSCPQPSVDKFFLDPMGLAIPVCLQQLQRATHGVSDVEARSTEWAAGRSDQVPAPQNHSAPFPCAVPCRYPQLPVDNYLNPADRLCSASIRAEPQREGHRCGPHKYMPACCGYPQSPVDNFPEEIDTRALARHDVIHSSYPHGAAWQKRFQQPDGDRAFFTGKLPSSPRVPVAMQGPAVARSGAWNQVYRRNRQTGCSVPAPTSRTVSIPAFTSVPPTPRHLAFRRRNKVIHSLRRPAVAVRQANGTGPNAAVHRRPDHRENAS